MVARSAEVLDLHPLRLDRFADARPVERVAATDLL